MGRRKSQLDSYDSILDVMTNVVGILVIVVAVTQVSIGDAVGKITRLPEVPDLDEDGVAHAREERAQIEELLAALRERWGKLSVRAPEDSARRNELDLELARLRAQLDEPITFEADHSVVEQRLTVLSRRRDRLKEEEHEAQERLRDAAAALDDTRLTSGPKGTLRVPSPSEERAEGKNPVLFGCRNGRVYYVDFEPAMAALIEEFNWVDTNHASSSLERKCVIVAARVEERDVGTEDFRWKVQAVKVGGKPDVLCELTTRSDTLGEDVTALTSEKSVVRTHLAELDPEKVWVLFRVWDDSFEAYLSARELAERRGLAVGWLPHAPDESWSFVFINRGSGRATLPD